MDGSAFDLLTRSFTISGSRRRALGSLFASAIGLLGARTEVAARTCKKIRNRKKRKKCLARARCTPNCDRRICGSDGCGGSCGTCPGGQQCCGNVCIPANQCCNGGCAGGLTCCADRCVDPETNPIHCGACGQVCRSFACLHGVCTCNDGGDCPEGCTCSKRQQGFPGACVAVDSGLGTPTCSEDADCPVGSACVNSTPPTCSKPCRCNGVTCTSPRVCRDGICKCLPDCCDDSDCGPIEVCRDGVCEADAGG